MTLARGLALDGSEHVQVGSMVIGGSTGVGGLLWVQIPSLRRSARVEYPKVAVYVCFVLFKLTTVLDDNCSLNSIMPT